jgi:hypothetical protein
MLLTINNALMTSGYGQFHTNEHDPKKPNKRLKPYLTIDWNGIKGLVDWPQEVDKKQAQWLIPSTLPSRSSKLQEEQGEYWLLWGDLDKKPPPLAKIASLLEGFVDGDFELFTTRSATLENQKARLLIPLANSLDAKTWKRYQTLLNNRLKAAGIIPDTSNQTPNQLCYLPNRGVFYDNLSKRGGVLSAAWGLL